MFPFFTIYIITYKTSLTYKSDGWSF